MTPPAGSASRAAAAEVPARPVVGGDQPILGQPAALSLLRRSMERGRMHHAWIFHGPFGVGKCTAALRLARLLLDPATDAAAMAAFAPPEGTETARLIDAGTHPDLHVIRKEMAAQSDNRELRERKQTNIPLDLLRERMLGGVDSQGTAHSAAVFRTAVLGHGKVFIIDEAELLEAETQNAMLKTLEEPPPRTWIILCTSQAERLLPTIRSRCQSVPFGTMSPEAMAAWWTRSGVQADGAARGWINDFAAGSPGMALLAVNHNLAAWHEALEPQLDALRRGRGGPALAETMATLVEEYAQSVVKENESASKEAANRAGVRLLTAAAGQWLRRMLRESLPKGAAAAETWTDLVDQLAHTEDAVRASLNLKHVFSNLVAQWQRRLDEARAAASGRSPR